MGFKRWKRILAIIQLGVLLVPDVSAATVWFAQSGLGTADGSTPANAKAISAFSTLSNGDTAWLTNTITSTVTIPADNITLNFAPGAKFSTNTLAANSVWITLSGRSGITIDGKGTGAIELTDNGTIVANGGTHGSGNGGIVAIQGSAATCNNITIQNLTIGPLFDRQSISEGEIGAGNGIGVYLIGNNTVGSNCTFKAMQSAWVQVYAATATSNLTLVANLFTNYNHGFTIGSGGITNPLFYNLTIKGNRFEGGDMFESTDGHDYGFHRNPMFFFNESPNRSGSVSNILVANNFIRHGANPQSHTAGTGAFFFDCYNNTMFQHIRVLNNISTLVSPLSWSGGGGYIAGSGTDVVIANNTALGWATNGVWANSGAISFTGTNVYGLNNICLSGGGASAGSITATAGVTQNNAARAQIFSSHLLDYNVYNHQGANSFGTIILPTDAGWSESATVNTFSQWNAIWGGGLSTKFDPHSITTAITLDSYYLPTAPANFSTNLTAQLSSMDVAALATDYYGNARPTNGVWYAGAVQADPGGGGGGGSTTGGGGGTTGGDTISVTNVVSLQKGVKVKGKVKFKIAN